MISAFGVDHGGPISKARSEREKHYGRMAGVLGATGGTAAALGAGSKVVEHLERKGKDPMGFAMPREPGAKVPSGVRSRILRANIRMHGMQAKAAGGVAAGSLALAGAYKHKQNKELAKRSSASDKALDAAAVGTLGVGGGAAGYHAKGMAEHAGGHAMNAHHAGRYLKAVKAGEASPGKKTLQFVNAHHMNSKKVAGIKGAAAAAGVGAIGLGAAGLYEVGRHNVRNGKKP